MIDGMQTLQAMDVQAARFAYLIATIQGNRYLLMYCKNIEVTYEKEKVDVPILGEANRGHRAVGGNISGSMTIYSVTSMYTKILKEYQDTGTDVYFDLQIVNHDKTSKAGKQTIILKNVNLDSGVIAAADADGEWLEQDIEFTAESFEIPEEFTELDGVAI